MTITFEETGFNNNLIQINIFYVPYKIAVKLKGEQWQWPCSFTKLMSHISPPNHYMSQLHGLAQLQVCVCQYGHCTYQHVDGEE